MPFHNINTKKINCEDFVVALLNNMPTTRVYLRVIEFSFEISFDN